MPASVKGFRVNETPPEPFTPKDRSLHVITITGCFKRIFTIGMHLNDFARLLRIQATALSPS